MPYIVNIMFASCLFNSFRFITCILFIYISCVCGVYIFIYICNMYLATLGIQQHIYRHIYMHFIYLLFIFYLLNMTLNINIEICIAQMLNRVLGIGGYILGGYIVYNRLREGKSGEGVGDSNSNRYV